MTGVAIGQVGMTSENALTHIVSVRDRIASVTIKLKELERIAQQLPQDARGYCAMFAHELGRCHQFIWHLLQDVEKAVPGK